MTEKEPTPEISLQNGEAPMSRSLSLQDHLNSTEKASSHRVSTQSLLAEPVPEPSKLNGDHREDRAPPSSFRLKPPRTSFAGSRKGSFTSMSSMLEDDDPDWENQAYGLFAEKTGDELYEQLADDQFKEPDKNAEVEKSGVFSTLEEKLRELKLNFNVSTTLQQDKEYGTPRPVGGSGFAKIVSNPKFPAHPFFKPSRFFRVRLRHNNLSYEDDARLDGRVACLKFLDRDSGGPLDLIMHTGKVPQYYTADTFQNFVTAFKEGPDTLKTWTFQRPINYYSRVENIRRAPDSYYDQRYYTQVTYSFRAADGVRRAARLRMVPADGSQQSGKPDKDDQENVWHTERRTDEKRDPNYLRREFMQRLVSRPFQYRLQIQLQEIDPPSTRKEEEEEMDREASITSKKSSKSDLEKAIEMMDCFKIYNSCIEWDPDEYQWLDLAIITITTPLSEEVLRKTKYQLTNQVESFSPALPISTQGFRSLVLAVKEFHGIAETASETEHKLDIDVEKTKSYKIVVVTGKSTNAGTDADVFITILGLGGKTKPLSLDQTFHNDFESGQTDEFEQTSNNVGEITAIEMSIGSGIINRRWFLEEVTITDQSTLQKTWFPCYQWLTSNRSSLVLRKADATIPQDELQLFSYMMRKYEIAQRRFFFQWEDVQGLPGRLKARSYDQLPPEMRVVPEKEWDLRSRFLKNLSNVNSTNILPIINWNVYEDTPKILFKYLKESEIVKNIVTHWKSDEDFGRQILNGAHPSRIERVNHLPYEFESKRDVLETMLSRKKNLDDEIKNGHIYILTYPELDSMEPEIEMTKSNIKRFLTSPSCLLYVHANGHLLPIAITLSQQDNPLVFTPKDEATDWITAKMWVRMADAQVHIICSRHLNCQLIPEAFAVATFRNLPSSHPVFKLLYPHLRFAIPLGVTSRKYLYSNEDGLFQKLLSAGNQYEDLLKESYRHFSLGDLNVPLDLESRGVSDANKLPNYFYRDDCLALWDIQKKYVRTVIHMVYWGNYSVQADEELQAWMQDIHEHALPEWELAGEHNIPFNLRTLDEVVEFVTIIMFTASCQYGALTAGIVDTYAFIPNAPTILHSSPPTEHGTRPGDLRKSLPNKTTSYEVIAACSTLANGVKEEAQLGDFPETVWSDKAVLAAIEGYKVDLNRLEEKIQARNSSLAVPYNYLAPSNIPKCCS